MCFLDARFLHIIPCTALIIWLVLLCLRPIRFFQLLIGTCHSDTLHFRGQILHLLVGVLVAELFHERLVLSLQCVNLLMHVGVHGYGLIKGRLVSIMGTFEYAIHLHLMIIQLYSWKVFRLLLFILLEQADCAFRCRND